MRINVCGDGTVESNEECEVGDLQNRTCLNLGYLGGDLLCYENNNLPFTSCTFNVSGCLIPAIDPDNVAPHQVASLFAAGLLRKPSVDTITLVSSLLASTQITINIPVSTDFSRIILPQNTAITREDEAKYDPVSLLVAAVSLRSLSGFPSGVVVDGALQWRISTTTPRVSPSAILNIYVGNHLDGQVLNIVRSASPSSGWTTEGIVFPATCRVLAGRCAFQATKAGYLATNRTIFPSFPLDDSPPPGPLTLPTPPPLFVPPEAKLPTPTPEITRPLALLPSFLAFFDVNKDGRIEGGELYDAVSGWVDNWKQFLVAITSREEVYANISDCDLNDDGECNAIDFSILLFYLDK